MERPRTEGGGGKGRQGRRRRRGEGVRWRRKDREKRGRQEIRGIQGSCDKWKERQRREDKCTNTWGLLYTVGKINSQQHNIGGGTTGLRISDVRNL